MPPSFRLRFGVCLCLLLSGCEGQKKTERPIQKGDPSHHGGTATIREPYTPKQDDPATSNDESNDQPLGHFGSVTLYAYNSSSGHTYTLDADVENGEVQRLYFPKAAGSTSISARSTAMETEAVQTKTDVIGNSEG